MEDHRDPMFNPGKLEFFAIKITAWRSELQIHILTVPLLIVIGATLKLNPLVDSTTAQLAKLIFALGVQLHDISKFEEKKYKIFYKKI